MLKPSLNHNLSSGKGCGKVFESSIAWFSVTHHIISESFWIFSTWRGSSAVLWLGVVRLAFCSHWQLDECHLCLKIAICPHMISDWMQELSKSAQYNIMHLNLYRENQPPYFSLEVNGIYGVWCESLPLKR